MAVSVFQKPALRVSIPRMAVSIFFPKAGNSRLNTAYGSFNLFKSRCFTPQNRLWRFQFSHLFFSKVSVSRLKNAYSDFNFFKAGVLRLKTAYGPSNFSVFFKSRRLAPQYRLRQFPFFQKPALRASKVQIAFGGFFFFSKAGASRLKIS